MAAHNLLIGYEAILDILHADSDSDIDCSDDESEQEMLINDNIHGKMLVQIKSTFKGF
jgi:hypothetical protein